MRAGRRHRRARRWRWRRGRCRCAPLPWEPLTEIVCGPTGQSHLITEAAYTRGLQEGHGIYEVLCGRRIEVASMVTPPGPQCDRCDVLLDVRRDAQ